MVDLLYPRVRLTKNKNGRSTLSKSKVNQDGYFLTIN